MPVKLNSSGGGSVTIDVPSTASAYTLTAPAVTANLLTSSTQSIPKAALPAGAILQVVQGTHTDITSYNLDNTNADLTGFNASITPTSSTSKILIMLTVNYSIAGSGSGHGIRIKRNGTVLATGSGATYINVFMGGVNQTSLSNSTGILNTITGSYLDSPATTSAITYQVNAIGVPGTSNWITNASATTTTVRGLSTIILMEVAA